MKVLLIPSWYPDDKNPINGIFFKEQGEALSKRGIEVIVLTINLISLSEFGKRKDLGLKISDENGLKVYRYTNYNFFPRMTELYLRFYGFIMNKLVKKIEKEEIGIKLVHIHSALDAGIAYYFSRLNIPYVLTEHSTKYDRNLVKKSESKYLYKVFEGAKKVVVVGNGLREAISKYIDKDRVVIIPNMVSIEKKEQEVDFNKKGFRFFSLGLLNRKKGMDLLIEAFNKNRDKLNQCELYIGGDGEERENLQKLIEEYGLNNNIKLIGKLSREEVAYHMSNCDCFVLASRFETFGIVYLEAMLYGKPVIATQTGGPDTFVNDENGILVPVDDTELLGDAIVRIVHEINHYDSKQISSYCNENFGEEAVCKKIINLYKDIKVKVDK